MGICAVLFDMDGVLVDAKEWHFEALNQALAHYGACITPEQHLEIFDGLPTSKKLEILSSHFGFPREIHSVVCRLKQTYTLQLIQERCIPSPIHQETLSLLKAEGYAIGLCSNSVRETVDTLMERTGLGKFMDLTLSNEDVAEPKPHPEIYVKAMDHFQLAPSECLIVEDHPHGIAAARASGAQVMVVKDPSEVVYERFEPYFIQEGCLSESMNG